MCQGSSHGSTLDAFTSSQDGHGGSRPNLKYKKLIHFLKGEWHTSLRHTKNVCQLLLQPPEPDPQTGHHEQMVFKGHHCQPTSTSHVLPASFLVSSTLWLRIFSFNSIPKAAVSRELSTGRQTIQKWMPQRIVVSFHVLKREYERAQLLSWHSHIHIRGGK